MAINPLTYVKQSKEELDKVVWPTKMETIRLTLIVLLLSIIVGAYIAGVDAIMAKISERFFR